MTEAIIVAVITTIGVIITNLLSSSKTQAVMKTKFEDFEKRTDEKFDDIKEQMDKIEKKQDKHNNMIERMYVAEGDIKELKNDIKELKAR